MAKKILSITQVYSKKYQEFEFSPAFAEAFGKPERCGVWLIWGTSAVGKSNFCMQLCKELARFGKVVYNSLEEGGRKSLQDTLKRANMHEVSTRFGVVCEGIDELDARISKPKSADIWLIDSLQYTFLNFKRYKEFVDKHRNRNKLIIFTSHANGQMPQGALGVKIMHDVDMKIFVDGHIAFSKGRYIGPNGGQFTIWTEGAALYHGQTLVNQINHAN